MHGVGGGRLRGFVQFAHVEEVLLCGRSLGEPALSPPGEELGGAHGAASSGPAQVWVNTRCGKYLPPGSRYYGRTREGAYITEEEARAKG